MRDSLTALYRTLPILWACVFLCGSPGWAEHIPKRRPAGASPPPVVVLMNTGGLCEQSRLIVKAVHSQMSGIDATVRVVRSQPLPDPAAQKVHHARAVARERKALAVVWWEQPITQKLYLHLFENHSERVIHRTIDETTPLGRSEAAAIIIRQAVLEMLRNTGTDIGSSTQAPRRVSAKKTVDHSLLAARAAYAVQTYGHGQLIAHGADFGIGLRPIPKLTLFAGYTAFGPIDARSELAHATFNRHPARIGIGYATPFAAITLGASVAFVADFMTIHIDDLTPGITGGGDRTDVSLGLVPSFELRWRLLSRLAVYLSLGAEIALRSFAYEVTDTADQPHALLDAWPVMPRLLLGLQLEAF